MIGLRACLFAILFSLSAVSLYAADQPGTSANHGIALEGKVKHPQSFDVAALRALPGEQVQVSFQTERGTTTASFTGVRLWAVLTAAGGIDDDDKSAALHHLVKVTGRDGYFVVLSTGEIAPDFGGTPALIAYRRHDELVGDAGLRLVMPGDKRGGRNVRDVAAIRVE